MRGWSRADTTQLRLVSVSEGYSPCAVYVVVGHRLGRSAELLSDLGPVDVEVAESAAAGAVDGDVVAVEQHSDFGAGVGSADRDHCGAAESDVAVGEDGEDFDLGVALDGELAWPAEGGCVVPGLLWGLVPGAVPTAGVVPGLIVVTHRLQLSQVGRRHPLGTEPGFEGAVVALNLAAGLRVIRAGVDQPSAGGGDNTGEAGGPGAAGSAGERRAVISQHQRRHPEPVERPGDRGDSAGGVLHLPG